MTAGRRIYVAMREFVLVVVIALLIATLIKTFLAQMFVIPSGSMENTLQINDRVMVQKVVSYHRGDIIVFADPANWLPPAPEAGGMQKALEFVGLLPASGSQYLIKRLIGLPGDHVACCDARGRLTVNGVALDESEYLFTDSVGNQVAPSELQFDVIVPKGHVFVMGDHRNASADSRYHLCDRVANRPQGSTAFVPQEDIQGPAMLLVFPFDRFTEFAVPAAFAKIPAPEGSPPDQAVIEGGGC